MTRPPEPCCESCGKPLARHLGLTGTCARAVQLEAENERLRRAYNQALDVLNGHGGDSPHEETLREKLQARVDARVVRLENAYIVERDRHKRAELETLRSTYGAKWTEERHRAWEATFDERTERRLEAK